MRNYEFDRHAKAYVDKLRANIDTLSDDTLDQYRLIGERSGADCILADLSGNELAELCDIEIAGRFALAKAEA